MIKDLLNIEVVATLNQAFCKLHHSLEHCSSNTYARTQCTKVVNPATAQSYIMRMDTTSADAVWTECVGVSGNAELFSVLRQGREPCDVTAAW